jgi:Cu-Zn family superoxide dismutase
VNRVIPGIVLDPLIPNGISGRAVVVHMQQDDLQTDPSGNSGARAACGVITDVPKAG